MSLVITGNPGVGKHTIADEFLKNEDYDLVDINKIAIESSHIEEGKYGTEVDVKNLKMYLKDLVKKRVLIVGHLAPYVIDKADVDVAIILRKNPYKLVEVYKKRQYDEKKIKENLGSEILGIIAHDTMAEFGPEKTFQVDTTEKTPARIVEQIQNVIRERSNSDDVDWLSEIKQKDDFQTFFDY
jgi:adenylate kinase